ncbi:MAG: sigma-54-dependent Fis family transcriptional regulator [Gemmatimonadaceae bacterium]|nr:sigma-54-dependent Fis family transcriptional regulator [Gemmatimonadaceae bacterium]
MKVLITLNDVEPAVRLNAALEQSGVETAVVSPLDDIRSAIRRERPDLLVLSGGLLDPHNVALVRELLWDGLTAVGFMDVSDPGIEARLRAMGYSDVLSKPIALDDAVRSVRRLLDRRRLSRATGLIGDSEAIREVLVQVEQIAPVTSTVLIEGESGTGKELVARAIHQLSPRRNKPFIAVNVGALPDSLLESELFGHEKGAFTGAAERRLGRFELAHGGTIFLDEIGDVPHSTQVKLLRVLEQRELTRVGGTSTIPVDVRVVAATNAPLREAVEHGSFRADLFYRLNVLRIYLPPLRDRKDDIPVLVRQFVSELSRQHDRPFRGISAEAMQVLTDYAWPGNVRELRNLIESMVVLAHGREVGASDIPSQIREGGSRLLPVHIGPLVRGQSGSDGRELEFILRSLVELKLQVEELRRRIDDPGHNVDRIGAGQWIGDAPAADSAYRLSGGASAAGIEPRDQVIENAVTIRPGMTMAQIERAAIENALRETRGNRRRAAELLEIGERTLYRKIREYELVGSEGVGEEGEGQDADS